jgi:hypothetical protein
MAKSFLSDLLSHTQAHPSFAEMQQLREGINRTLIHSARVGSNADERLSALEEENEHLKLCVAALVWAVLESGTVKRERLAELAADLDALDGQIDGKLNLTLDPAGGVKESTPPPPAEPLEQLSKAVKSNGIDE